MTESTFIRILHREVAKAQKTRQGVNAVIYERTNGNEIDNQLFSDSEAAIGWIKYSLPYDDYEIRQFTNPVNGRPAIDVMPSEGDYMGTVWL